MFRRSHSRLINRLVVRLESNVKHHDCAVVASDGYQGRRIGVEVNAHHSRLCSERILRPSGILNREAANETTRGLQKVVRTVGNSKEILVFGIPCNGSYIFAARFFCSEAP